MANKRARKWNLNRKGVQTEKSKSVCDIATIEWSNQDEITSRIEIDLVNPSAGALFSNSRDDSTVRLFGIDGLKAQPNEPLDPYTRANDLIVNYPVSNARAVGAELYWRSSEFPSTSEEDDVVDEADEIDGQPVATLELIYSLETDLLDSQPNPAFNSIFEESSTLRFYIVDGSHRLVAITPGDESKAHACIVRDDNSRLGILMALVPTDVKSMEAGVTESGKHNLVCELNSSFLEKGVIRRLRAFAAFTFENSDEALLKSASHFLTSQIPLTA